ncbi:hypothetical protein NUTIK01_00060 [Novosphingobium sp. IK01]|uniref:Uncharacterized protein n=1 Tax=Novosphingobium pituita TaxID=3056842 RepID=A0ABQ6P1U6_9SPHN|nr:hypothetical protein NUTIK01_00060 [Novosphingobium sp. IK01]
MALAICSGESAVMAIGVFCSLVFTFCAVTVISVRDPVVVSASAAHAGVAKAAAPAHATSVQTGTGAGTETDL